MKQMEFVKKVAPQWFGYESVQYKRYLKSKEQKLCKAFGPEWREVILQNSHHPDER
tara:strand:+ start:2036 stop:2203 length:168 start_codon:yes stop_codon:yes gene_type:complete